jgi:hypothetical protein
MRKLKTHPILLSVTILLLVSFGCSVPGVATPDPGAMETTVAQMIAVALTQTAQSQPITPIVIPTDTPPFTFTPESPTLTPTETLTPTPIFTSTPAVPQISVSVATNCRVGPGRVYDRVGALLVGQVAEVAGRNNTGNYWYIRNPNRNTEFCWLWGEYATLSGNTSALPVYTPPPTPTPMPNFEASYGGKETCAGWWVDIDLKNTGGIQFRSVALTVRDLDTDISLTLYADGFTDNDGCLDSTTRDNLNPGATRTVSSPAFTYDPTGHRLRATVTLCSNLGQNGTCVTRVINFTP